jgi:hypothetical protein
VLIDEDRTIRGNKVERTKVKEETERMNEEENEEIKK